MASLIVTTTSVTSLIGFIINVSVLLLVLLRGKKRYHLLFAPLLMITACWDIGIFLVMIRNSYPSEVLQYQNLVTLPIFFFPTFIFLFTTNYLNQSRKILTIALCAYSFVGFVLLAALGGGSTGVYQYSWGTVAKYDTSNPLMMSWSIVFPLSLVYSCWLLFRARRSEASPVTRRHITYILASFIVFGVATVKILVTMGFDLPFTVPLGMLLVDTFGALIGIAILKHQLFDITGIVKKGTIYSAVAVVIVFLFSLCEDLLATYAEGIAGGFSEYLPLVSLAVVIAAFMPLEKRLDRAVNGFFAKRRVTVEF